MSAARTLSLCIVLACTCACGAAPHRQPIGPGEEQHVGFVVVDDDAPRPPPRSEEPTVPDVDVSAPADPVPAAELIEAGEEPRMPLDYHLRAGQRERVELRMTYLVRSRMGRRRLPPRRHDFRLTFDFGPVQPARDRYRIPYRVVRAAAPADRNSPEDLRGANTDIAREILGTHGLLVMDFRGRVLGVSLEAPDAVSPVTLQFTDQLREMLRGIPTQLPTEEVGIGGSWRVHEEFDVGMHIEGDATLTLLSLDGDHVVIRVRGEYEMASQPMPGVEGVRFQRSTLRFHGEIRLNLGTLAAQAQGQSMLSAQASAPGAPASRRLHMELQASSTLTPMLLDNDAESDAE